VVTLVKLTGRDLSKGRPWNRPLEKSAIGPIEKNGKLRKLSLEG